jgi:hypothetical protein
MSGVSGTSPFPVTLIVRGLAEAGVGVWAKALLLQATSTGARSTIPIKVYNLLRISSFLRLLIDFHIHSLQTLSGV